ncbi:synaptonemal complex protein 1 isoform X2 [Xyrichtys novacula]|uniref:Synaptonemal complex protein 1 isoform X2 n=1 Tax=Xyrichtys novacula TaxID=13765 RepID=A0AAV1ENH5_XYRNO|nr:synaptonemal complex protein 1 isoform X2 [Xyrichtys novacula]
MAQVRMERDRSFNFKLSLPTWAKKGQISAVRPQEIVENCGDLKNSSEQGYTKGFDKEQSMSFANVAAPAKPTRQVSQDISKTKVVPPMEKDENSHNPGQLCTKLFDEVEKLKFWKIKADSDALQKERRLQENKKTIETQRKAIQELQFGNESLSIKLEEQISENEELRNKNNATRSLCNILKDALERSAEKMQLFESEREETHHLLVENGQHIQKLITAFDSLRIQADADQEEMKRVKEGLQQFEIFKEKCKEENDMKEKESAALQTKLGEKEKELQKTSTDFCETQKYCKQLEDTKDKQSELLKNSENKVKRLLQKLQTVEQCFKDTEEKREAIAAELEKSKIEYADMIQNKDLSLQELSRVKTQQAEELEQIQTTIEELQNTVSLEKMRAKELEDKLVASKEELEGERTLLGETVEQSAKKDGQIQSLEDELIQKSKSVESMKSEIKTAEDRVKELEADLLKKNEEAQLLKNEADLALAENDLLKKTCKAAEKEREDLEEKSAVAEIEAQELEQQLFLEKKKNEEHTSQMEALKTDITQSEIKYAELLSNFNGLQSEKKAVQQQLESGSSNVEAIKANIKVSEERALKQMREIQKLEKENQCLREELNTITTKIQGKHEETETHQKTLEEKCEHLQEEITEKEKQIKAVETKLCNLRKKFELKLRANEEFQRENKTLKKQIAKETAKSSELEIEMNSIYKESENLKQVNEEDHQRLLKDLESKSTTVAELENEVEKLKLSTAEAIKSKEDAELKCQHKIADMVALMEKHKGQCDRMVEEKDAELEESKQREMEAVAQKKSLEVDLLKNKTDNAQLKQQLKTEVTQKANLQKELTDLKKDTPSVKIAQSSEVRNKQSPALNYTPGKFSNTPKETKRHLFDFSRSRKNHSISNGMRNDEIQNGDLKNPLSLPKSAGRSSKIKSYRIRTPPSTQKGANWRKTTIELDPKSDSSELNDHLNFGSALPSNFPAPSSKLDILNKIQSPAPGKSPGNCLKLAAIKRMRDAGWTAVTGCDSKKKKTVEKIFA